MVAQYRAIWNGLPGGTGFSVFNFNQSTITNNGNEIAAAVRAFFAAIAVSLPDELTVSFDSELRLLDTVTGTLTEVMNPTVPANVNGGSAAVWSAPSGARVDWNTNSIVQGNRLQGHTYIVPISSTATDNVGTLGTTFRSALQTAANDLISAANTATSPLQVWSRTHGVAHDVATASIKDQISILRGRRD